MSSISNNRLPEHYKEGISDEMGRHVKPKVEEDPTLHFKVTWLKYKCRFLLSIVKKFPTMGNANGPGGKLGGSLFFR